MSMEGYSIYHDPVDYPGQYVTRRWYVDTIDDRTCIVPEKTPAYVGTDLVAARAAVPFQYVRFPRSDSDDPAVLEVWI